MKNCAVRGFALTCPPFAFLCVECRRIVDERQAEVQRIKRAAVPMHEEEAPTVVNGLPGFSGS